MLAILIKSNYLLVKFKSLVAGAMSILIRSAHLHSSNYNSLRKTDQINILTINRKLNSNHEIV